MTQQSQSPPLQATARDKDLAVNNRRATPALWLRLLATASVSSVAIAGAVLLAEVTAPQDWRPTSIVAGAAVNFETLMIEGTVIPKAEAELMIEESRAEGQRNAEITFQKELKAVELDFQEGLKEVEFNYQKKVAVVQANLQDSIKSYESLYQRANMIQQVAYQMEASLMSVKQDVIKQTQGGRTFVTNLADLGCYFSPEACEVSRQTRQQIANDLVDVSRYRSGEVSRDYLKGVQDPAKLRSRLMPNGY